MKSMFDAWLKMHGKQYDSTVEYDQRLKIFMDNADMVAKHNSGKSSYTSTSSHP